MRAGAAPARNARAELRVLLGFSSEDFFILPSDPVARGALCMRIGRCEFDVPPKNCTTRCATFLGCSGAEVPRTAGSEVAMKKSYRPEQIVRLLQDVQAQLAAGASQRQVARQLGVNPGTLSRWQHRYGGVQLDEARRMFVLEKENVRLKRIVAELELDKSILKEALQGKY